MGCQSCGRARTQVSRSSSSSLPRASAMNTGPTVRTVDSQTVDGRKKVQTAVASNPNSAPTRTKV